MKIITIFLLLYVFASGICAENIWKNYTDVNFINCLATRGDYIWCGTMENGVFRLNRHDGSITEFSTENGLISNYVNNIVIDLDGIVWIGTFYGLSRFDGTAWTSYTTVNGLEANNIIALAVGADNRLWLSVVRENYAIQSYNGIEWETHLTYSYGASFKSAIAAKDSTVIWLGNTDTLVTKYTYFEEFTRIKSWSQHGLMNISYITVDKDDILWVTSNLYQWHDQDISRNGGVSQFDGKTWIRHPFEDWGLDFNIVFKVVVDDDNTKWFGTGGGLVSYDGIDWKKYTEEDGLLGKYVRGVASMKTGIFGRGRNRL